MRITILLVLFSIQISWGQKVIIEGILSDSAGNALPSATVLLLNTKDSSLLRRTPKESFILRMFHGRSIFLRFRTLDLRLSYFR
jgi:hypothetical protein